MWKQSIYILLLFLLSCRSNSQLNDTSTSFKIIDHNCNKLQEIPLPFIDSAKANLHIAYWRASHGSQLTNGGMTAIRNFSIENNSRFNFSSYNKNGSLHLVEIEADLQHENTEWVAMTENYLSKHPECNVVMWAWCNIYEMDIDQYLADMEILESKYSIGGFEKRTTPVTFVYMTAHSWPWKANGKGEWVFKANQKIREYCITNNKWLYDFTDLESYNPDGEYFGDGDRNGNYLGNAELRWDCSYNTQSGRGNWGIEWMNSHPDSEVTKMASDNICISCQHSEGRGNDHNSRLHCILKGNAAWWLWARLAGWSP